MPTATLIPAHATVATMTPASAEPITTTPDVRTWPHDSRRTLELVVRCLPQLRQLARGNPAMRVTAVSDPTPGGPVRVEG